MLKALMRHVAVGALCVSGVVTGASAETLTDALIDAYKNSQILEQNRALLRAADEDVAQSVARLRPVLDYVATYNYSDSTNDLVNSVDRGTLGLQASLLLYDFGQSRFQIEASKEAVLATREALRGAEQSILQSAVSAYLAVRRETENVSLGQNNVRVITEQLRAAEDRFQVGEVTRTDVAQAEARLASSISNLTQAQGQLEIAREFFIAAVGRAPGNLEAPPPNPRLPGSIDEAKTIARDRHPTILQAQRNVRAQELLAEASKNAIYPTLSATANLDRNFNDRADDDTDGSIGLRLQGPIYQGGAISSRFRQTLAQTENARASLNQSVLVILQETGNAWSTLRAARAVIDASVRGVEAAQIAFEGVREEARLGARTTLDVLDAEQDLLDARTTLVAAEIAAVQAVYDLLSAMGLLTVDYLGLAVPTYDPAAYYNAVKDAPATSTQGASLDRVLRSISRE